jgi:hypothetical protein
MVSLCVSRYSNGCGGGAPKELEWDITGFAGKIIDPLVEVLRVLSVLRG